MAFANVIAKILSRLRSAAAAAGLLAMATTSQPSQAELISPRRLLEVRDLSDPVVAPDGRSVAFRLEQASITRNSYDSFWYVEDLNGKSPPRRIGDAGMVLRDSAGLPLPSKLVWSPDQRWIYYRASIGGRIGVWRAAVDGSRAESVTDDPADVRDFRLSADGRSLQYDVGATREQVSAAEQAEYDHGIHVDDTVPVGQGNLFHAGNLDGKLATQRFPASRETWERVPLLASVPDRWKIVDLATGETSDLSPSDVPPRHLTASDLPKLLPTPLRIAPDPVSGRIAMLTPSGGDEQQIEKPLQLAMLPDKNSSRSTICRADPCTVKTINSIEWRPHSDEILFTVTDPEKGPAQSIYRWNVVSGAVRLVAHSGGLLNGGRDPQSACGASDRQLVCVAAEADRPPRLEAVDLETGHRRMLFAPNAALAKDMAATAPSRFLRWTDAKGRTFTGRFFPAKRKGGATAPLFVTYYSCAGFLRGGVGDEWPLASLAENGISALCINRRAWRLDAFERYDDGLSAVRSAVDLLASRDEIDRARVGMGGLSLGSEVTLWTDMKSDILAAASVTSPGMSSEYYLFGGMRGDVFYSQLRKFWQLDGPVGTPERWRQLSPAWNLDKIEAPILMQMPEQEYVMALEYAIPLIRMGLADLYVFPNEPHQKFQPRHKLAAYQRNLDWFRYWLQDYEDPDPSKAAQYKVWRAMREARDRRKRGHPRGLQDSSRPQAE